MKSALPRLRTVQELAEETGVPVYTWRRLLDRGELRRVHVPGIRRTYVLAEEARRCIELWAQESSR